MMNQEHSIIRLPLYRQVAAKIREELHDKRPGDRVATEAEFQKRFGVSLVTIRQALRELEDEGQLERRHGSGTFIPDSRIPRRHVALLLDADPTHPRLSPYFPKMMQELRAVLNERGIANRSYYGFGMPTNGHGHGALSCQELLDDVQLKRVHGLISFFTTRDNSWEEIMRAYKVAILDQEFCWQHGWLRKTHFIHTALAHLKKTGRRRLAILASGNPHYPVQAAFYKELSEIAPQYGIQLDERLVDLTASAWQIGMGWERLRDLWRSRQDKPDSLLVMSDMLFADCQKAIMELGIASSLETIVVSSDAMELRPLFPVQVYRTHTRTSAEQYANTIAAMLTGEPLPHREFSSQTKLFALSPSETQPQPQVPDFAYFPPK